MDRWVHDECGLPREPSVEPGTVLIHSFRVWPPELWVTPGSTVRVSNTMSVGCRVTAVDGTFDSGLVAGRESATFPAPNQPGRYPFACAIHNYQQASLVVDLDEPAFRYPLWTVPYPSPEGASAPRIVHRLAPAAGPSIDLLVQDGPSETVAFPDRTFRLLARTDYRWEPGPASTDVDALTALIADPSYEDTFLDGSLNGRRHGTHGPYRLDRISTASFTPQDVSTATELIAWANEAAPLPDAVRPTVDQILSLVGTATSRYRLALSEADRHDHGWVLRQLHELVLVHRPTGRVSLIVAYVD